MLKSIEQLKEALQKELQMYLEISKLAENKTNVIVKGKVKELEELTKKEQKLVTQMSTFEKIRRAIFVNISNEGRFQEPNSLSELLLYLEEMDINEGILKEIDDIRNSLLEVIAKIKDTNQLNEKLIKQSLDYINLNMELLTSIEEQGNQYGNKATTEAKKSNNSLLDVRV